MRQYTLWSAPKVVKEYEARMADVVEQAWPELREEIIRLGKDYSLADPLAHLDETVSMARETLRVVGLAVSTENIRVIMNKNPTCTQCMDHVSMLDTNESLFKGLLKEPHVMKGLNEAYQKYDESGLSQIKPLFQENATLVADVRTRLSISKQLFGDYENPIDAARAVGKTGMKHMARLAATLTKSDKKGYGLVMPMAMDPEDLLEIMEEHGWDEELEDWMVAGAKSWDAKDERNHMKRVKIDGSAHATWSIDGGAYDSNQSDRMAYVREQLKNTPLVPSIPDSGQSAAVHKALGYFFNGSGVADPMDYVPTFLKLEVDVKGRSVSAVSKDVEKKLSGSKAFGKRETIEQVQSFLHVANKSRIERTRLAEQYAELERQSLGLKPQTGVRRVYNNCVQPVEEKVIQRGERRLEEFAIAA